MKDMFEDLFALIKSIEKSNLHIFLHNNADPDAICAAFALKGLIENYFPGISFNIFADGINQSSKKVADNMGLVIGDEIISLNDTSIVITLDTANFIQLGKFTDLVKSTSCPRVVIDHHDTKEMAEVAKISILDPDASSTCIMIAKEYIKMQITPSPKIATLIIIGHLYDSRRFLYGSTPEVFRMMAKLIDCGGDFVQANAFLQNEPSLSERVARIKAMQRVSFKQLNGKLIATSRIGAFEASTARSLIGLGADVVLVIASKKDELRGSARISNKVNLNIAEILNIVVKPYEGEGGGHKQAAGFNIKRLVSKKEQKELLNNFTTEVVKQLTLENPKT